MLDLDSWMGGAVLTIVYMLKVSLEKTKAILRLLADCTRKNRCVDSQGNLR